MAPLAGIAAIALAVAGILLMGQSPGDSDQEVVAWWSDSGNRTKVWIGTALFALGIVSFVWYASGLRDVLRRTKGGEQLAALAFGGALVFATLSLVTDVFVLSIPAAIDFGSNFVLDPNTERLVETFSYLPVFAGAMALSLTVGAVSIATRKAKIFPRWVSIPGYALAPALLLSVPLWGIPLAVFGLWVLVTSALMLRGDAAESRAAVTATV